MAYDHRDFDKLNVDIFAGKAGKRVLFQPRINCWYDDKKYLGQPLPGELEGCTPARMYRKLKVSNRIYDYGACFERRFDADVKVTSEQIGERKTLMRWTTPVGELTSVIRGNSSNPGCYYDKFQVETPEDIRVRTYLEEATVWSFRPDIFEKLQAEWKGLGAPTMFICRTTIQECIVETMGVENTVYALTDEPELMEGYFEAITRGQESLLDALIESPIQIINYGDNLHGGILSPYWFEKYIQPVYLHRRERLKPHGKFLPSHWDGDLKPLLPYTHTCGLDGIEAMTPLPQGDVPLEEILESLGDDLILLDGIAAILFQDTYPEEMLMEQVETLLQKLGGRLILGISDEMPSLGDIERVKKVRDRVERWNAELKD